MSMLGRVGPSRKDEEAERRGILGKGRGWEPEVVGSGPGRRGGPGRRARGDQKPCPEANPLACPSCSYYNTTSVLLCLGITALVCLSVTVFSFQTKVSPGAFGLGKVGGGWGAGAASLDSPAGGGKRHA